MYKSRQLKNKTARHDPLERQLQQDRQTSHKAQDRPSKGEQRAKRRDARSDYVAEDLSKKILDQAREQLEEEQELERDDGDIPDDAPVLAPTKAPFRKTDDSDEEEELSENEEDYVEDIELNPEDEKALEMFMSTQEDQTRKTLADVIMEKLRAQEGGFQGTVENVEEAVVQGLNPKVVEVYRGIGEFLKRYKVGKLPKAFKIIPVLSNWEEILFLTGPDTWTPSACYQATRLFASNLNQRMAQRFYNILLLPRVREDIHEHKRLNFWLYMALKKALYKSAAFYKGILLPLCEAGDCTLREATIIGSVLSKVSIPLLQSSAALLKLAEMQYSGANSVFIRVLLDKKYALPYRVLAGLVNHFIGFATDPRELPVLWHQALLTFVQRYKNDLNTEQKDAIRALCKIKAHHRITDEVRRELAAASTSQQPMQMS